MSGSEKNKPPVDEIVNPDAEVDAWAEEELEEEAVLQTDEGSALVGSVIVHVVIILALAFAPLGGSTDEEAVVLVSTPTPELIEEIEIIEDISYEEPTDEIGAEQELEAAEPISAEEFSPTPEINSPMASDMQPADFMANEVFKTSSAPTTRLNPRNGGDGVNAKNAAGAIDRLTFEILQSLEERKTLVVWLFDQSASLQQQRQRIRDRFDLIYEELGVLKGEVDRDKQKRGKMNHDAELLTSIVGFGGKQPVLYTDPPSEDVVELKKVIDSISIDSSGTENVFTAVKTAADKYKTLRRSRAGMGPQRNVMFVVVTDERGDDEMQLESAIQTCRGSGIPVYVIGVPAPFGLEHTLVKYVDPDPKYDQTPQFAQVDQGPETLKPEYVRVGFTGDFQKEPVLDSGFGPYSLTRMCYETGGIYFSVHPNRTMNRKVGRRELAPFASTIEYFFDSQKMASYRPDYLSPRDYDMMVRSSPLRSSLVNAAKISKPIGGLSRPRTKFVQENVATLAGDLTTAQQDAARLEQPLGRLAQMLEPGMKHRDAEDSLRWKAGYDLAMGRVLAQKVRTETYNAMLAKAKRGMTFKDKKNNTWNLKPDEEISVGSKWEREAKTARELLTGVATKHDGTPWALLAKQELQVPIGWKWEESFTDITPRKQGGGGGGGGNPQDDKKRMLKKTPKRAVPKL